jgi:conjugal transfer pilus assembly protein TraU
LAYLTEVDPLWADDELTAILNPGGGAVRQRASEAACAADCVRRNRRHADREPVLVRWLPGLDLPDGRTRRHPHRRRAGLHAHHPAHDRQDAPAAGHVRPAPASAGLCGYYPLPIMDKTHYKMQMVVPGAGHRQGGRPVLPALWAHAR